MNGKNGKFVTEFFDQDRRIDFEVEIEWERWWESGAYGFAATNVKVIRAVARFDGFLSAHDRVVAFCPIDMSDACMTAFVETYADDLQNAIEDEYAAINDRVLV